MYTLSFCMHLLTYGDTLSMCSDSVFSCVSCYADWT